MTRATDVLLTDGSTVHLRPIEPSDADAIVAMHARFSDQTRYLRYFSPYPRIPARDLARFVNVDHVGREAFVIAVGERLIAVGRYERLGEQSEEAEVAFVVEDAYQGRGVGSVLLEHLAAAAREHGISRFVAEVLPANGAMLRVFVDAGYEVARKYADGVVHLTFPTAPTDRSRAVQWERERRTEAASVARLLRPTGIAVFGASRSGQGVGAAVLAHLREGGFPGEVAAIGKAEPCPAADLAVVAVPPAAVPDVVERTAKAGVHGLLVLTDLDPAQRNELLTSARSAGMRVIGPGSLGIADTSTGLNATLVPRLPAPGRVALFCQSGTLGLQLLAEADRRALGVSAFVSVGRRADVSGNDLLQFWAEDPRTDVIAMYLETFGNPRKFARIARTVGRQKPIVVLSGQTSRGAGVAGSALDDAAMQALRAHSGVIEVGTVAELMDVAKLLSTQPLPAGERVGVVSNAFALTALAAGRLRGAGLTVGRSSSVGPAATPAELAAAVSTTLSSEDADSVLVVVAPPLPTGPMSEHEALEPFAAELRSLVAEKPLVVSMLTGPEPAGLTSYRSLEEAIRALGHVARRAAWLREPAGELPPASSAEPPVAGTVGEVLARFGIPVWASRRASTADGAVAAALELGFPAVLKAVDHPHRIDLGAVRLNLPDEAGVLRAYGDLAEAFGPEVMVQSMAPPGVACTIEMIDDPAFGPVIGFGLGGPVTELVGDMAWRAAPLTDRDAYKLVRAPKAAPLLAGADLEGLARLLVRIGQIADEVPGLHRLSLNPVLAHGEGWTVLHATGELTEDSARPDVGPRKLSGDPVNPWGS